MKENNLVVSGVDKTYAIKNGAVHANRNVSFAVDKGNMAWLAGASGSGKTTLMNIITGLDKPNAGTVYFDKDSLLDLSDKEVSAYRSKNMGLIFQHFELVRYLKVRENLNFTLQLNKMSEPADLEYLAYLIDYLEIRPLLNNRAQDISGGQKQRVSIARALSHRPHFVIGDEITSSLDTEMSHKVYQLLKDYSVDNKAVVLCISHDPIIENYATQRFQMQDGVLLEKD